MKNLRKAFSVLALSGALVVPAIADDTTAAPATNDAGPAPAAAAPTTDAKDQKDLKKVIEDQGINYVETAQKGITLSGYVDTSYTYQFAGAGEYGAPGYGNSIPNSHAALHQFDTSNNTFNINAVKIALEKALPDKNEWAAGFRIDTIYGEDARYLGDSAINGSNIVNGSNLGAATNTSGLALEQALVKFRIPVGNGLDIYAGKFVTFLGYEVIESPANLNFSRGLLFTNAIPLTHTGVYADYKFNDMFEAKLGIVDGWNNSTSQTPYTYTTGAGGSFATNPVTTNTTYGANDQGGFGKAITGQLVINAPGKNASITQSFIYSPEGEPEVVGVDNGPVVVYDIWGNWNPTFVKDSNLLLGFNIDLGYNGASGTPTTTSSFAASPVNAPGAFEPGTVSTVTPGVPDSNTWYGVALYAQYKFNKVFNLAGRLEYLHEDAALEPKFAGNTGGGGTFGTDDYEGTLTASFNIWDNLLTRIEYRHDVLQLGAGQVNQDEITLNAVYSF